MTDIRSAMLPKDERGNDPNDFRNVSDFIEKIEIESSEQLLDSGELPEDIDTLQIETRPFIIEGRLLRGSVSCVAGPPGVGKSAFEIATVVSIASGQSYLGEEVCESGKCWLYNNEEDRDELLRRYVGFCKFHGITPSRLREKLYLSSGYGKPLVIAKKDSNTGEVIPTPIEDELIRLLKDRNISVLSVDPIISTHLTEENSNIDAEQVMSIWRHVAAETNCAINLPSHISKIGQKSESDSFAGNLDAIRGASAFVGAARQVHTLARMGPTTAKTFAIEDDERINMVRLDSAKGNYSPPAEKSTWLTMRSQCLDNHSNKPDWVGVFTKCRHDMVKSMGARIKNKMEGKSILSLALSHLNLNRGSTVALCDVVGKLMSRTDKSKTWIYEWIPRCLEEHNSREAEINEVEFTWAKQAKKSGGKAQIFIHREFCV